jgi:two-component system nitrogen regulation response regulator GlnG
MSVSSSSFTILLFTHDTTVQALVRQVFKNASVTIARDVSTFQKELPRHRFDAVVMESQGGPEASGTLNDHLNDHLDPSRTLCIRGSKAVLKKTLKTIQLMNQSGSPQPNKAREASLESYLEVKMGEFVKGMRNGSAKNLHPILISAVERPLITSALRETGGNQIQAAELLGLNRNTLRKKIVNLHIPLKQTKARASQA